MCAYMREPAYIVPYKRNPYDQEMKDAIMRVIDRGSNLWGYEDARKEMTFFEIEFAEYFGKKYAFFLNSTLTGIYLLFRLQGIGPGDECICHANIEPADITALIQAGGKPVFVDVEEDTLNIDVTKIESKITEKTKAIFPVYAHGHPVDMDPILELAEKHSLYVLEDFTHACGAKYKGKKVPLGDVGVVGLYLKGLWLPGSGAMLVTDDKETKEKLDMLRSWDGRRIPGLVKDANGHGIIWSLKTLQDDIDAAVGRIQLRHLDEYIEAQRKNAGIYSELLEDTPVIRPVEKDYAYHVYLRYVIRTKQRNELQDYLRQEGIHSSRPYPQPAHEYEFYKEAYGYQKGDLPVTERLKDTELTLPEPRPRTQWEMEYVAKRIKEFFK